MAGQIGTHGTSATGRSNAADEANAVIRRSQSTTMLAPDAHNELPKVPSPQSLHWRGFSVLGFDISALRSYIRKIPVVGNYLVPNRLPLPPEIMSMIFHYVVDKDSMFETYQNLFRITLSCRQNRDLVNDMRGIAGEPGLTYAKLASMVGTSNRTMENAAVYALFPMTAPLVTGTKSTYLSPLNKGRQNAVYPMALAQVEMDDPVLPRPPGAIPF
jgi:hypothetical protein